ncbi:MAG: recombinase family protein [Nitrosospira sp.]|nr:recombinase family protein [Nitrosospira sp.]
MALYGYARVSTSDQDFALQEQALRAAGCEVVRAEKMSGTSREGRIELQIRWRRTLQAKLRVRTKPDKVQASRAYLPVD